MDKIEKAMRRAAQEREGDASAKPRPDAPEQSGTDEPPRPVREVFGEALADRLAATRERSGYDAEAEPRVPQDVEADPGALRDGPTFDDAEVIKPAFHYTHSQVGRVDPKTLEANRVISDDTPERVVNAYKMLRTQVLQRLERHNMSTIAVVSARDGEGRTLTAINLGLSIARDTQHTTLLVDLDLREPGIHKVFGHQPQQGLEDHLFDGVPLSEVFFNPGIQRFLLLPTRAPVADSSELLASRRVGELVDELKMRYDSRIVLFDLPPLLEYDDALAFLPHVDAVLVVTSNGRTRKADLTRMLDLLGDKPIVGTVLNRADSA